MTTKFNKIYKDLILLNFMSEIFNTGFIEYSKIAITAVLIYVIIYALLKKIKLFDVDEKVNALIALLAAIIVSFSGVVTYAVSYMINWFVIIFMVLFLAVVILLFFGVKLEDVTKFSKENGKIFIWVFIGIFGILVIKSFFALNNTFDTSNPTNDSYSIDTSFNTGVNDITGKELKENWWQSFNIDSDLIGVSLFLLIIGIFIFFIGKTKVKGSP